VESGLTGSAPEDLKDVLREKTPMRFVYLFLGVGGAVLTNA
jgi:hypothetical protein